MYSRYIFPFMMDLAMRSKPFPEYRKELLDGISGKVLELGAGTGLNLPYYSGKVSQLTVIDPNPGMNYWLKRRIKKVTFPVEYHEARAESLPFPDKTFDFVVCSFTMCSIEDLPGALFEVKRVMNPNAEFRYVEHGISLGTWHERWQHRLTPLQKIIGDGCHLNRQMHEIVASAGFSLKISKNGFAPNTPGIFGYIYSGHAVIDKDTPIL